MLDNMMPDEVTQFALRVKFSEHPPIEYEAFSPTVYDRKNPISRLSISTMIHIAHEMDEYKNGEMEVHPESVNNTSLYT
ncbi:hypothetical protein SARC_08056 [Sphaeroforma arctica JP610]|uniref:Uncharacterized protein n=1 Tax=Sphaeroforma arctica JP610 TaxID=667725 RepID=A0A0L0FRV8_9EUKA|nr:hypothetical protein SARC_08056 [Sphaeroforma arctica JP610]KNC79557.1 hypothetical protein SARC_08056 [Sphaeroforma arctica JP610]|eukprot:XP_014153459.1 hypothetical protein SARC_08056 [Sphaeroforma arctica JP610]